MVRFEHTQWSIVLAGSFDPTTFHPSWFEVWGIISKEAASRSKVEVIKPDTADIIIDDLEIRVTPITFDISTLNTPEIRLLDFVSKLFGDALPHLKINEFEIGKSTHLRAASPEKKFETGRQLSSTSLFGRFDEKINSDTVDNFGGLISLQMRKNITNEESREYLTASIQPSHVIDPDTGIFISVHRRFSPLTRSGLLGSKQTVSKLHEEFEPSLKMMDEVIHRLKDMAG